MTGDSSRRGSKVLLVCMPMGLVQTPNLALSLLKPSLGRAGITCDVRYLNIELLSRFVEGEDLIRRYVMLVDQPSLAEVCASYFADRVYGPHPRRGALVDAALAVATDDERSLIGSIESAIDPFLSWCLESIAWDDYAIVGFTSLFAGMTMPSIALAQLLKARFPAVVTVLGGWNTGGEMGRVIAERCPAFDYILRGEAEETFVDFARRALAKESPEGIAGLVYRDPVTGILHEKPQTIVGSLDAVPEPDFDDYFAAMAGSRFSGAPPRGWSLPFESARGCWWGEIRHCKFCGLNGLSMPYRSKSPARLLAEVDRIVERYQPRLLFAADTVLDAGFYSRVLPSLSGRYSDVEIAYEIKAPVQRWQMEKLSEAGIIHVTVGIESLSTRLLQLMDKGTTCAQNVHCLRLACENDVNVGWQYLYGFPNETLNDYATALARTPLLHHLSPPLQACPMTLARFSPYFDRAAANGIGAIRPHRDYEMVFPWPDRDLKRLCYLFEFEFDDGRPPGFTESIAQLCGEAVAAWRADHPGARLDLFRGTNLSALVDTRRGERRIVLLEGAAALFYEIVDAPQPASQLAAKLFQRLSEISDPWSSIIGPHRAEDLAVLDRIRAELVAPEFEVVRVLCPFGLSLPRSSVDATEAVTELLRRFMHLGIILEADGMVVSLGVINRGPTAAAAKADERYPQLAEAG